MLDLSPGKEQVEPHFVCQYQGHPVAVWAEQRGLGSG